MRSVFLVILGIVISSCALMVEPRSGAVINSKVRSFPSALASEADFINLVTDDPTLRVQAVKNISIYYNCLVKATPDSYQRQDPTVLNRSQIVAFSEIPSKIYDAKMEKLAGLINDQNKSAMQGTIEAEIKNLSNTRWNEIKKEVNAFVAGGRKSDLDKYSCPLNDDELKPRWLQLTQEWWLTRPAFIPPFM